MQLVITQSINNKNRCMRTRKELNPPIAFNKLADYTKRPS